MLGLVVGLLLAAPVQQVQPVHIDANTRFVWCRSDAERIAVAYAINSVSRGPLTVRLQSVKLAENIGTLELVQLPQLVSDDAELSQLLTLWDSLANDEPYFHERRQFKTGVFGVPVAGLAGSSGVSVGRAAVCRGDWLVSRLTSSVNRGRYLDFRGLQAGKTKLDDYLRSRGALPFKRASVADAADERAGLLSRVTGKPRAVVIRQTSGTRPSAGPGYCAITEDVFDESTRPESDAFTQLIDLKPDGREVMVTLPNGWIEYTLFDGAGVLVAEAPGNLVTDDRIPSPFTKRLNGMISCVRCHSDKDGWQAAPNEVAASLTQLQLTAGQVTLSRLAGQYGGDFAKPLALAREALSEQVFYATRVKQKDAAAALYATYGDYEYRFLTETETNTETQEFSTFFTEFRKFLSVLDENASSYYRGAALPASVELAPTASVATLLARLQVKRQDLDTGKVLPLQVTRRQWESVFIYAAKQRVVE